MVVRHYDIFTHNSLECRRYSAIERGSALEEDALADSAVADNAIQIIRNYRISQAGNKVAPLGPLLLVAQQVRLHKHRASLT